MVWETTSINNLKISKWQIPYGSQVNLINFYKPRPVFSSIILKEFSKTLFLGVNLSPFSRKPNVMENFCWDVLFLLQSIRMNSSVHTAKQARKKLRTDLYHPYLTFTFNRVGFWNEIKFVKFQTIEKGHIRWIFLSFCKSFHCKKNRR